MTATPNKPSSRRPTAWIVAAVVAVVVIAIAVVSIVATSGGSDTAAGVEQMQPAEISGTALPPLPDGGDDPAIGLAAPVVDGLSFDGTQISIEPGKPTVLVFLAHWCPHCQREVPVLTEWAANGGVPEGVDVIGVATATTPDRPNYPPSDWLARESFPFPVIADTPTYDIANAYGLASFPFFVAIDADGNVTARASGELDTAALEALIQTAL